MKSDDENLGIQSISSNAINYAKENGIVLTAHNSKESISISALCLNKNVKAIYNTFHRIKEKVKKIID